MLDYLLFSILKLTLFFALSLVSSELKILWCCCRRILSILATDCHQNHDNRRSFKKTKEDRKQWKDSTWPNDFVKNERSLMNYYHKRRPTCVQFFLSFSLQVLLVLLAFVLPQIGRESQHYYRSEVRSLFFR